MVVTVWVAATFTNGWRDWKECWRESVMHTPCVHTIWGWRNRPIQFGTQLCGCRSWVNKCETERQRKVPNKVSVVGTTEELLLAKLCSIQNYSWRETMREWLYFQPQTFYSDVMTELLDFRFKLLASGNVAWKIRRIAWLVLEVNGFIQRKYDGNNVAGSSRRRRSWRRRRTSGRRSKK